jgi:hypothetical protein
MQSLDRRASLAMTIKKARIRVFRQRKERSNVAIPPQNLSS